MHKKLLLFGLFILSGIFLPTGAVFGQTDTQAGQQPADADAKPVITYTATTPKRYTIADITVNGVENFGYDDFVLIGMSGLTVGDKISIPGDEITAATRNFWRRGLFSQVQILADKMTADSVWLKIQLTPNPMISEINFHGVKKSEMEDLEAKVGIRKGSHLTPNLVNRARKRIQEYFDEKAFTNADVRIQQKDDVSNPGMVSLDIYINKNEKTKISEIILVGNEKLSDYELKVAMKKTNERFSLTKRPRLSLRKLFSTKKFVREEYENDLENLLLKYNEKGYRDARIVSDSVATVDDKRVKIFLTVEEGNQYHIRDIRWVGNTIYHSDQLEQVLNMSAGDIYDQKKLNERLSTDEDAVGNLYYNSGYIFSFMVPVESHIQNDSVDLEIRVQEGMQATINRIIINGNDRLYEDVIRRELLTKPGQLFNKEALMRSAREISQMGHFDPETMDIQPIPDQEAGTVDISYNLTSKASDQIELSAGWGQTGVVGRVSLKFTNFSINNLLHPDTYKGIIPQGDGQTLTLSAQTNARYYQSYSVSFLDPWFGGKRPNTFSLSAYYMMQTGMDSRYYDNYYNSYSNSYYYNSSMGGYDYTDYLAYDENQSLRLFGLSAGYGKRLSWPDNYFNFMAELSYQRYMLSNWNYFIIQNGNSNNVSLGLTLSRSSIDNPFYTRTGSQFSLSVQATPPYSLWDGKDYSKMAYNDPEKNDWIEYHKWKFKARIFMPLTRVGQDGPKRTPVLMSRIEYGFVGSYNKNKRSPFETFYVGGDGMTGYSSMYATETIGLRGYANGSLTPRGSEAYAYSRMSLELRYPFLLEQSSTIYGLVFVEAGNAWQEVKAFNPFELKRAAGFGARIFLPMVGMLGVDWGYGFDSSRPGMSQSKGNWHFLIGQEF